MHEIEVLIGEWGELGERAAALRHEVFVIEQAVPVELELDEYDGVAVHALALEGGMPVGTGRLLPDGHIGRMAVRKTHRRRGIGGMLLRALIEEARRRAEPAGGYAGVTPIGEPATGEPLAKPRCELDDKPGGKPGGGPSVVLSAQTHAQGFYRAHGFEAEGEEFMDAGIPHILMRKML